MKVTSTSDMGNTESSPSAPTAVAEVLQPLAAIDTRSSTFALASGRRIGYCEQGAPTGKPVFFLHGQPGSRLDAMHYTQEAARANVRLIGIDRPGVGLSTPTAGVRTLRDHAEDIGALADHLKLPTYRVLGGSAGGPFALAAAATLPPDRLVGTGVSIGLGPLNAPWSCLGVGEYLKRMVVASSPWLTRQYAQRIMLPDKSEASVQSFMDAELARLTEDERRNYADPDKRARSVATLRECVHQGVDGFVQDAGALVAPWGFDLKNIKGRVRFWYGDQDPIAPAEAGRWMSDQVPNATLKVYEGDNHGTVLSRHMEEILKELVED